MDQNQTDSEKQPSHSIKRIEFHPNGDGTFSAVPVPKLSKSELREVKDSVTIALQSLDADFDGKLSFSEVRNIAATREGFISHVNPEIEALNAHNATYAGMPWLQRNRSVVIDDSVLFDRDTLMQRLLRQPEIAALGERELERIVASALPAGVASVRISNECAIDPDLECTPLGTRLFVTNRETSGPTF